MEIALKLAFSVGVMFIMMAPGIILKKCGLSVDGLGKGLSNLVLYVAQPVLVFSAYLREFDAEILLGSLYVLIFSVVAHGIFTLVAMLSFKKAPDAIRRMLRFATIFSNAAFMGMPLIEAVLGAESLIYASVYNITFNVFLWSLGVHICTADRDYNADGKIDEHTDGVIEKKHKSEVSIAKVLLHPVTLAAILGLVFFFLPLSKDDVPELITQCLDKISALVAPLSMIVLGLRLAELDLKGFFKDINLYVFLALRHVILPAIVWGVMRLCILFGLGIEYEVVASVLIMAAAPAATSATMFAEKYNCDAAYVSKIVAASTILSLVTMPLVIMLATI